jgi:hypothetical protein
MVYVDNDPMVLAHSRALKTGEGTAVIQADLRHRDTILGHPDTRRLIDFSQPLAVLFIAVLHFIADADARAAVAKFTGAAAPGSYLELSHVTGDPEPQAAAAGAAVYAGTSNPITLRTRHQIVTLLAGAGDPGARPGPCSAMAARRARPAGAGKAWMLGGVARKPAWSCLASTA